MNTAWGKMELHFATAEKDGTMPLNLEKLGKVLEGTGGIENEKGDVIELKEEGGGVVDSLAKEGKLIIKGTLIGIPEEARNEFWNVEGNAVKSFTNHKKFATRLCVPDVLGSETIDAPYCSVSMGLAYSSDQGYTADVEVTVLKHPVTETLIEIGTIA